MFLSLSKSVFALYENLFLFGKYAAKRKVVYITIAYVLATKFILKSHFSISVFLIKYPTEKIYAQFL